MAQQVSQAASDNDLLVPMVEQVGRQCRGKPERVSADSGFFSIENLRELEGKGSKAPE